MTLQYVDCESVVQVLALTVKSVALLLVTPETLTVVLPMLVSFSVRGALVEPTALLPNAVEPEPSSPPGVVPPPPPPPPATQGSIPILHVYRNSARSPRSPITLSGGRSLMQQPSIARMIGAASGCLCIMKSM